MGEEELEAWGVAREVRVGLEVGRTEGVVTGTAAAEGLVREVLVVVVMGGLVKVGMEVGGWVMERAEEEVGEGVEGKVVGAEDWVGAGVREGVVMRRGPHRTLEQEVMGEGD